MEDDYVTNELLRRNILAVEILMTPSQKKKYQKALKEHIDMQLKIIQIENEAHEEAYKALRKRGR